MGLFNKDTTVVENPNSDKPDKINITYLNGYAAIKEQLDETNTLIVRQPVVENEQSKIVSIGFN